MSQHETATGLELLRAALESLPDEVLILDSNGVVRWANAALSALAKRPASEMLGRPAPLYDPDRGQPVLPGLTARIAASSEPWQGDLMVASDDGSQSLRHWTISTVDGTAAERAFVCLGRKTVDHRWRQRLFDSMIEGVVLYQAIFAADGSIAEYRILDVNHRYEDLTGYRAEDVINRLAGEVYQTKVPIFHDCVAAAFRTGQPIAFEMYFPPIDKHLLISVALMGEDRFATVFFDVSDRHRAQQSLQHERNFTDAILDAIPGLLYMYDSAGHLVRWNKKHEEISGLSPEQLAGMHFLDRYEPADRERVAQAFERVMTEGRGEVEACFKTRSGKPWPFLLTGVRLEINGEKYLTGIGIDLTLLRQAEEERTRLEKQLQQAQKLESIGRLAGGVAHDFNNLLTVINGYSGLLLDSLPEDDPLRHQIEAISKAGAKAADLTGQLLAFSRKQIIQPVDLDLNRVARDIVGMLGRLIGENIVVSTALDPDLGVVRADAGQMHQVLMNLVVNARDAMPDGGRILIETANVTLTDDYALSHPETRPGPCVMLAVTDTGHGMDEATRQRIFDPFFTTKEAGHGTGLGLATTYGIVRQNGGWIWVYSEPGEGATFKIYLPRVDAARPRAEEPAVGAAAEPASGTILVVEDHADVRQLAGEVLSSAGYTVLEAADGLEALSLSVRQIAPIHLMVTDVVLPGMNGRELAERIKASRPEMRVLFTSGYTENVIAHRGVLEPGVAYLPKPFSPATLLAKVREVWWASDGSTAGAGTSTV